MNGPAFDLHNLLRAVIDDRLVAKEILKDLWREAKTIHEATA